MLRERFCDRSLGMARAGFFHVELRSFHHALGVPMQLYSQLHGLVVAQNSGARCNLWRPSCLAEWSHPFQLEWPSATCFSLAE